MKNFIIALALILCSTAHATTQAQKQANLLKNLERSGSSSAQATLFLAGVANVYYYDTYAELAAASPTEGVIGYAIDTNAFYLRSGASWVGVNTTAGLTGDFGGTLSQPSNNVWTFSENSEDITLTFGNNSLTLASTTGALFTLTPATTVSGDLTLNGGAGALTFGAASSSVVVPDNSATALVAGSTGMLNLLTLDTRDGVEKLMVTGTTGQTSFHNDVGLSLFDEAVTLGAGVGALTFTGGSGSILLKDATAASLDIGSAGRTNLLRFDTRDNQEQVVITGTTATVALSVPVGQSSFVEGVLAPVVASAFDKIRLCGNGSNANTPNYMKPLLEAGMATDFTYGAAACDGNDSTTLTTADLAWGPFAYKPVSMTCAITGVAGGNDDVVVFQLYDDTAAVTDMTCSVTMSGTSIVQCTVRDASPATIASASQITVGAVAVNDDLSTADAECDVIVDF